MYVQVELISMMAVNSILTATKQRPTMAFNVNSCLQRISEVEEVIRRMEEQLFWNRIERQQRKMSF